MSRSIHTNHRIYNSELKADHANEEEKKSRLKKIRKDISKKREMKKQMGQRLRADKNPGYFVAVAIESVPIRGQFDRCRCQLQCLGMQLGSGSRPSHHRFPGKQSFPSGLPAPNLSA